MYKSNPFFLLLIVMCLFSSCREKDIVEESFKVNFRAVFGEEPLVMYARSYPYEGNMFLKFHLFQFYLSDLRLIDKNGIESPQLLDITLVNFGDIQDQEAALGGLSLNIKAPPPGNYTGIVFGIGVSPALNKTQPGDYDADHPLSINYWDAAKSYIFTKIEGLGNLNSDNVFDQNLTFHIGGDRSYRDIRLEKDQALFTKNDSSIDITIDLRKILVAAQDDFLDFREITQVHTMDSPVVPFIAENYQEAFTMK